MKNNLPIIYGFNYNSEMGDKIFSPVLFLYGCNLKCPYCMNSKLVVKNKSDNEEVSIETIKDHVIKEKSELVVISGGEPTCTPIPKLLCLIGEIRSWGCKVGMSTNGTNYDILKKIIKKLDFISMDVKGDENCYAGLSKKNLFGQVIRSYFLLNNAKEKNKEFDYELRTTLYPEFITKDSIKNVANYFEGANKWVVQQFRPTKNMISKKSYNIQPYNDNEVEEIVKTIKKYVKDIVIRYV